MSFSSKYGWLVVLLNLIWKIYRVHIKYRRILLRHNLSMKCKKIVKFVSITHSERNIWNGPIVATAVVPVQTATGSKTPA